MEILMTITAGILLSIGTYLLLTRSLLRLVLGSSLFTHGVHIMLLSMAGLKTGAAPLLGEGAKAYTDPLPHALLLTSIVINFALTALFLVLSYRTYQTFGTDDLDKLRGSKYE